MAQRRSRWKELILLMGLVCVVVWILAPRGYPRKAVQTACANNLKQIGMAIEMYAADWGDHRPPLHTTSQRAPEGQSWPDLLMPYLRKIAGPNSGANLWKLFRCPESIGDRLSYSVNRRIAGMGQWKIKYPSVTIAVFDSVNDSPENNNLNGDSFWRPSDGGVPSAGGLVIWPGRQPFWKPKLPKWASPRHHSTTEILCADGHVTSVTLDETPDPEPLRFDPAKPKGD